VKKPKLDTILLVLAVIVMVVFFVLSSQDERIVKPVAALPLLHKVLLATVVVLVIGAGLLSTPKRTNRAGIFGTLAFGAIYFIVPLYQALEPPVLSTALLFGSMGVHYLIQATKQFLMLRSTGGTSS
jgi:uncharacterized membrane protein